MSTLTIHPTIGRTRIPASDADAIERNLRAAYAHPRIEEIVRAVLEDTLHPASTDGRPWDGDPAFEADFTAVVTDITDATVDLVAESIGILLETVPPRLAGRLAAAPRFVDRA